MSRCATKRRISHKPVAVGALSSSKLNSGDWGLVSTFASAVDLFLLEGQCC